MIKPHFICNLSGISAADDEIPTDGSIPESWVQIKVVRKFSNPKWEAIQDVKQSLIQQTLAQIAEGQREEQLVNVVIQVEAQYALLESQTEEFVVEEETVYLAPPESDAQLFDEYNKIRESIGLEKDELEEEEPPSAPEEGAPKTEKPPSEPKAEQKTSAK